MRAVMVTADVDELAHDLAKYLARVKAGEPVVVTEGGQPIARLDPAPLPPEFWDNWAADPEGLVLKALLEERGEGW